MTPGADEEPEYTCRTCGDPVVMYEPPGDRFFSHRDHPVDHHDAVPVEPVPEPREYPE
jgi:hypothetical protein